MGNKLEYLETEIVFSSEKQYQDDLSEYKRYGWVLDSIIKPGKKCRKIKLSRPIKTGLFKRLRENIVARVNRKLARFD